MASKSTRVGKKNVNKFQGRTIDIVVGVERKVYSVHEQLIRASSVFFDKVMAGEWTESRQRTVQLPDDDPEIFALYVHWLYCGTLPVFCDEPDPAKNDEYMGLIKAYVLGDKLLDAEFHNAVIDAIVEESRSEAQDKHLWFPGEKVIEYAYENTTERAPIRRLLVDMWAIYAKSSWLDDPEESAYLPHTFLLGLLSKRLDSNFDANESIEACNYHTHKHSHDNLSPPEEK
ncbi:hypothetical protein P170DRAFT_448051 [Aspergillus steynii IBT 23096]|uniref:BTB domain-containing protein n=1 Tax=Aspergillus steynii IBT 23096 TaxID=1392250 RepID=A0A2I2G617_9EURO|nr:uncharacterized protein P170DRAFT_448051 [Aspergillus steynii IBT 23096]PLB48318.1 hypothetical protein P170DRAFT_448051 [Aspergillus steynii IBT 23096]